MGMSERRSSPDTKLLKKTPFPEELVCCLAGADAKTLRPALVPFNAVLWSGIVCVCEPPVCEGFFLAHVLTHLQGHTASITYRVQ